MQDRHWAYKNMLAYAGNYWRVGWLVKSGSSTNYRQLTKENLDLDTDLTVAMARFFFHLIYKHRGHEDSAGLHEYPLTFIYERNLTQNIQDFSHLSQNSLNRKSQMLGP